jgi:tetrahydromethanopterin S-methyltransferase subunit G
MKMKILPRFHWPWYSSRVISESRIQIQYDVDKPVDLVELTLAFGALNRQYRKFVKAFVQEKEIEIPDEDSVRLFITKIESNCITAELGWVDAGTLFTGLIVVMDNYNTMHEFLKKIGEGIDFVRGKVSGGIKKELGKKDCEDFRDILVPAFNGAGLLGFKQLRYDAKGNVKSVAELAYISEEVAKALAGANKKIEELEAVEAADHQKVLMYLESIEKKIGKPETKRTHDYGVIESVSKKTLRVVWLSEMDQAKVKEYRGNHFKCSLLVDANVETVRGEPKAIRVLRLHEIIPDEEAGD